MKDEDAIFREVQLVQLEMLLEFDKICKKNAIRYQLFAGTLLGAIRHKGFIPWDDDIDVCLLREDYDRFLDVCQQGLSPGYFLQTYETDPDYIMQFAKIRKNNTIFLEQSTADCDIHHGVYIDLFPLDKVRPNTLAGWLHQKSLYVLHRVNLTRVKRLCLNTDKCIERALRLSVHYIMKVISGKFINRVQSRLCCIFNKNENVEFVSHLTNGPSQSVIHKHMIKISEFHDIIEGEFEKCFFPIPKTHNEVLSRLYGDYIEFPPLEKQISHHNVIRISLNGCEEEKKKGGFCTAE